jgi:predicted DNA-binding protein
MGSVTDSYERIVQELSSQKGRDKANTMRAISEKTLGELQEWQKQLDG